MKEKLVKIVCSTTLVLVIALTATFAVGYNTIIKDMVMQQQAIECVVDRQAEIECELALLTARAVVLEEETEEIETLRNDLAALRLELSAVEHGMVDTQDYLGIIDGILEEIDEINRKGNNSPWCFWD